MDFVACRRCSSSSGILVADMRERWRKVCSLTLD
jgi:hypothetical protein